VQNLINVDRVSRVITVYGERLPLRTFDLVVPGDTSSAAYPIALGSILPESAVTVPFVGLNAGRIAFFRHLQAMGAHLVMTPDPQAVQATGGEPVGDITVHSAKLRNVPVAPESIPAMIDEIPLLAVVACLADRPWEIRNAERLRVKETDRIRTTIEMLRAMGAEVEEFEDGMGGPGGQKFKGGRYDCLGDHRISMACAVAAWCATGPTELIGGEAVKISFPRFFQVMSEIVEHM
jgi:3-phosphoshikimate 1-carboxyvinyltransferase